jgi:hypothetical protein
MIHAGAEISREEVEPPVSDLCFELFGIVNPSPGRLWNTITATLNEAKDLIQLIKSLHNVQGKS